MIHYTGVGEVLFSLCVITVMFWSYMITYIVSTSWTIIHNVVTVVLHSEMRDYIYRERRKPKPHRSAAGNRFIQREMRLALLTNKLILCSMQIIIIIRDHLYIKILDIILYSCLILLVLSYMLILQ